MTDFLPWLLFINIYVNMYGGRMWVQETQSAQISTNEDEPWDEMRANQDEINRS